MFPTENRMVSTFSIAISFNSLIIVTLAKRPRKSTTTKAPTSTTPKIPDYCPQLQANLQIKDIESFVKILNKQYNRVGSFPKGKEACYDTLDKMLYSCSIYPIMYDDDAVKKNDSNLIIKLRYDERSCHALRHIISKFLTHENFDKLRLNQKVTLLALAFSPGNPGGNNNAISEWIALFYEDGKISKTLEDAQCLWHDEFKDLVYKSKRIVDYFPKKSS